MSRSPRAWLRSICEKMGHLLQKTGPMSTTHDATQPASTPGTPRHRAALRARSRSAVPALVWAAMALHVGVMLVFALLYPPYLSFDEKEQVSRVLTTQHGLIAPAPGTLFDADGVTATWQQYSQPAPPPMTDHSPTSRDDRPTFTSVGDGHLTGHPLSLLNQLSEHPPGYYLLGAGYLDAIPHSSRLAWDQTVSLLRLLDIVLIAPLPLLCWGAARRFTRSRMAPIAAAFAPLLVPALARLGASVNNDDLLICTSSFLLYFLAKVATGDFRTRTAVGAAISLAAALFTKGLALIFPPVVVAAYLVAWWRSRTPESGHRASFPWVAGGTAIAGAVAGAVWWARNWVVYGAVQPSGLPPAAVATSYPSLPAGQHGQFGDFVRQASSGFATQFWGALGLPTPPRLPLPAVALATGLSLLLVLAAFVLAHRQRLGLVVMALPVPLVIGLISVHSWHEFARTGAVVGFQGRYLYECIVGLAVIVAVGIDRLVGLAKIHRTKAKVAPWAPLAMVLLVLAFQFVAVIEVVDLIWLGHGRTALHAPKDAARAIIAYSPWQAGITVGVAVAAIVAALATLAIAVRHGFFRRPVRPA